jgi:hypothetical protein
LFSLPTGTEMFHFPALPPNWLYIHQQVTRHHSRRVSPFGHPRIHARLTAPRGISQPPTSFIGSQCQGIHHAPLNTYNTKNQKSYELKNSEIAHQHTNNVCVLDARNHYPQIKHHTPPPKWSDNQTLSPVSHPRDEEIAGLLPQSPIVCLAIPHRRSITRNPYRLNCLLLHQNHTHYRWGPSARFAAITEPPHDVGGPQTRGAP